MRRPARRRQRDKESARAALSAALESAQAEAGALRARIADLSAAADRSSAAEAEVESLRRGQRLSAQRVETLEEDRERLATELDSAREQEGQRKAAAAKLGEEVAQLGAALERARAEAEAAREEAAAAREQAAAAAAASAASAKDEEADVEALRSALQMAEQRLSGLLEERDNLALELHRAGKERGQEAERCARARACAAQSGG